ncbi:MAG TPA: BMP family ABC transporter substrate-binding protein [Abditibacteriaceae bacterium]|nr:BMP family ABC transporter substrate-binding protein [Abditibacteriaceae bacterium]
MKLLGRCLSAFALVAMSHYLAGCGQPGNQGSTPDDKVAAPPGQKQLTVALLTPGDINDQGWNQLAYEGLQAVEKELGAKTSHQVTKSASDQQPALRDLADQGFALILCHGFEYGERVKAIAPKYPDTKFVVVGGNVKQEPNVATLVPKLEDATYLLGMAAGGMTKSNVIGEIGGMKLPTIKSTFDAFAAGAKAVNPRVKVQTSYVGNFEDQNAAKEAANAMLAQGADVLFHNADQAGKGMFDAAQDKKGVLVFGSNRNQNSVAPTVCLASAVIEMPRAFVQLARDVQSNKFKADFIELNLPQGTIAVEWNEQLKSTVPPALMKKINEAEEKIKSGTLKIPRKV